MDSPAAASEGARTVPGLPAELIVLSHLRWTFVWQRPQHLVSRLAQGRRTWFIEEPWPVEGLAEPRLLTEQHGQVLRVWLEVPGVAGAPVCFSDPRAAGYEAMLLDLIGRSGPRAAWLYTPMALPLARAFAPTVVIYDVMDDLAAFRHASSELVLRQRQALEAADVVFTGGRSLHRSVASRRSARTYCFPSGVEPDHYVPAAEARLGRSPKVAGYVGVIDERLDLALIDGLAACLPDWEIRMVGPVVKIDPTTLPQRPNIVYAGPARYDDLAAVMGGFDVALMPFAMNEATRSLSPTKTLEYLAAGLPVVSTPVPDVVADFAGLVDLQDDGPGFAAACRRVERHSADSRAAKAQPLLHRHHWDTIARCMGELVAACGPPCPDNAQVMA